MAHSFSGISERTMKLESSVKRANGPIVTVAQFEERQPATKGKLRSWIGKADKRQDGFDGLRRHVIRVGRSVMLDEAGVMSWLASLSDRSPAVPRNPNGCKGKPGMGGR
jgi:hypothetical protein